MKIVLSRKGFDSGNGGHPSPILNGQLISFPIPETNSDLTWEDVEVGNVDLEKIVRDLLGVNKLKMGLHLDPDLNRKTEKRLPGWKPTFGQAAAAASHLINQNVGKDDLFLFFGWYRHIRKNETTDKWEYFGPDLHALFGWLEIDSVVDVRKEEDLIPAYPFMRAHPHFGYYPKKSKDHNLIFFAKEKSDFVPNSLGGGVFKLKDTIIKTEDDFFKDDLILTKSKERRSKWSLPDFFDARKVPNHAMTYHGNLTRWTDDEKNSHSVTLQTVSRGQEFVIDSEYFPEVENWAIELIKNHT